MKTVAISIDEYIYEYKGVHYVDNVGFDIIKRYADNFEQVNLISRVKHVDKEELGIHNQSLSFANITCFDIPFFQGIGELLSSFHKLKEEIRKALVGCHIAIVRSPSILGFFVLNQIGRNMPYALEVVANPYEMYLGYSGKLKLQSLLMHILLKKYCRGAVALAFVTRNSQQKRYELNKHKENNTYYSSIELKKDFFSDSFMKHDVSADNEPLKIAHVSNVITGDIKGHKEVIEIAAKLFSIGRDVDVTFAGDGPDVPTFKKYAEHLGIGSNVHFVGFVNKLQLRSLLMDSDFFVFPSKSEGLPKVLIEAMAVSVPSIASNVGGIPELLPPENVFASTDVEGMLNRIIELSSDKEKYIENARLMYNTAQEYESSVLNARRKIFYSNLIK